MGPFNFAAGREAYEVARSSIHLYRWMDDSPPMPWKIVGSPCLFTDGLVRQVFPHEASSAVSEVSPRGVFSAPAALWNFCFPMAEGCHCRVYTPSCYSAAASAPLDCRYGFRHLASYALRSPVSRESRPPGLPTACAARASAIGMYFFRNAALIYGLELLALVLFFEDRADSLLGT